MLAWLQVSRTMVTLLLAVVLLGAGYVVGTTCLLYTSRCV